MKIKHYLTGPLQVNTYLAYDETTKKGFIVDPGGYESRLTDDTEKEHIEVEYIILTHGHGDHIGGGARFKQDFLGAKVIAYQDEIEMLQNPNLNTSVEMFGHPVTVEPDILVRDNQDLKIGNMTLTFLHTPGHTKGGMCIYADGCLFSGDPLFRYSIGRTDFYGGDYRIIKNSIRDRLYVLPDDTAVFPGHMGATTIGEEKRGNPFV